MLLFYWMLKYFPTPWIPVYWMNTLDTLFAVFLFAWKNPKRKPFLLFFPLSVLLEFGFAALAGTLREPFNGLPFYVLSHLFLDLLSFFVLWLSFTTRPISLLLDWVGGICVRQVTVCLYTFLSLAVGVGTRTSYFLFPQLNPYLNAFLYDLFRVALIVPLSLFFRRYTLSSADGRAYRHTILLSSITIGAVLLASYCLTWYSEESKALNLLATFLGLMMSLVLLILRTDFLLGSRSRREAEILHQVLESERKEYEQTRESIHSINAKVHDIRHVLERYGDSLAMEDLAKLKKSVEDYDSVFHTGNEVLDTILASKLLLCREKKISLSAYCDGKALSALDVSVCYYLFTNLLDNAIEAVDKVKDPSERLISLTVRREGRRVRIECQNYFTGALSFEEDGSLKTSKKDKKEHGYGLKSIRLLLKQLGGESDIHTYRNLFYLTLFLPAPEKEKRTDLPSPSGTKPTA